MIAYLLLSRLIQGGLVLVIVVVVGSLLYLQHVEREHARFVAETAAVARRYEKILERAPQDAAEHAQEPAHDTHAHDAHSHDAHSGHTHPRLKSNAVTAFERISDETIERLNFLYRVTIPEYVKAHGLSEEAEWELYDEESAKILTEGMSALEAAQFLREYSGSQYRPQILSLADLALAENPEDYETLRLWVGVQEYHPRAPNPVLERGYKRILELYPDDRWALWGLASATQWDKPYKALDAAMRANELDPRGLKALDAMAYALQRLGEYDFALAIYKYGDPAGPFQAFNIRAIEEGRPHVPSIFGEEGGVPLQKDDSLPMRASSSPEPVAGTGEPPNPGSATPRHPNPQQLDAAADAARQAAAEAQRLRMSAQQQVETFLEHSKTGTDELSAFTQQIESDGASETGFSRARLARAMEILRRHGASRGMQKLRATDPDVAAELEKKEAVPSAR